MRLLTILSLLTISCMSNSNKNPADETTDKTVAKVKKTAKCFMISRNRAKENGVYKMMW